MPSALERPTHKRALVDQTLLTDEYNYNGKKQSCHSFLRLQTFPVILDVKGLSRCKLYLPRDSWRGGSPERDEHDDVHDDDGRDGHGKGREEKPNVKSSVI